MKTTLVLSGALLVLAAAPALAADPALVERGHVFLARRVVGDPAGEPLGREAQMRAP